MLDISRGEPCPAGNDDPGNLCVTHIDRLATSFPIRGERCCGTRRRLVEIQNPSIQVFVQQLFKGKLKRLTATPARQARQSELGFEKRYAGYPDGLRRLHIQPSNDWKFWPLAHERRDYIGVQYDHYSKSAERAGCPVNSGRSVARPMVVNRVAIREPNLSTGRADSLAAARRICRISSSMLRPNRLARRFRPAFTDSSRSRTTSCATLTPRFGDK
jgi:hypothetical protein